MSMDLGFGHWRNRVSRAVLLICLALGSACGQEGDVKRPASRPGADEGVLSTAGEPAAPRPNLILITLDTTRADALGAYGQQRGTSPSFDRLAADGVLFEQANTTNPETLPSHATILTGRWPYSHGVRANAGYVLSDRSRTLAEHLAQQGYRTGVEIAAPVLRQDTQITQGFHAYRGPESANVELKQVRHVGEERLLKREMRVGSDITKRGIEFLRTHRNRAFFLWLHYFDAHSPYAAPRRFNEQVPDSHYHAEVAYQDFQLGLLISELERLGLKGRTLVVITSDHGEGLDEHGEPSHSYFVYDTTMRVPLLFWGLEGLPKNRRLASLVRTVDIAPSVLELMQLPPLPDVDGVSLVPLIAGRESDLRLTSYGEAHRFYATFGRNPIRFIREKGWKYIHKVNPELYDIEGDPREIENLAQERPEIVDRLRARMEQMLLEAPPRPDDAQAAIDARTAAQLIALGYVAESPAAVLEDEMASLRLDGDDPLDLRPDLARLAVVPALIQGDDFEKALLELAPVLERHPGNTFAANWQADALIGLERYGEARVVLERVLRVNPDDARAASNLALASHRSGDSERALRILLQLAERDPCDRDVQFRLGDILHEAERYAEELEAARDAAKLCPQLTINLNNYAWLLATLPVDELRDGPLAVEIIRTALEKLEKEDGSYLDTYAAALAEAGRFEEAVRAEERAVEVLIRAGAPPEALQSMRDRVERYRAGKPTRVPIPEAA